jgi:predicted DNA-binding transcriptional regulator YafY
MDKLERLYSLHGVLQGRRTAISLTEIAARLECSPATAKRAIRELRTLISAPLVYDRERDGYRYAPAEGASRFELPGLWFPPDELAALVTLRELLARLEPGLLAEALAPLSRRLEEILARRSLGLSEEARRIRVISQHARAPGASFAVVARGVLDRRMLAFRYARRADGQVTDRRVSPQRLTRYRGCWYLDAWCHDRKGLRSFALERISEAQVLGDRARDLPEAELDAHYADAYGIFAGKATETAVLRVAPHRARWVADEAWHPRQSGSFRDDGSYELRIPYGRPDELIMDILRLAPDVEVLGPPALRQEVARRLREAAARYEAPGAAERAGPAGNASRAARRGKKAGHRVMF